MVEAAKEYLFIDGGSDISEERIAPGPYTDIGAELRAAREARDLNLLMVAQDLRIKEEYLRSLESGAYEDLPGIPYAIGFVRSYAKYLRLDPGDMVRRFKAEVNAAEDCQLEFPQPVRYGRFPGAALVAASLLLAGLLYGGWYFYGAQQQDVRTAEAQPTGEQAVKAADAAERTDGVAADAAGKKVADDAVRIGGLNTTDPKAAETKPGAPKSGDTADAKTDPRAAPKDKDEARSSDAAMPGAVTERTDRDGPEANNSADATPTDAAVGRSVTTSGAPDNPSARGAGEKKAQVAALPKDDAIVLRATANAWVQIKDRDNRVVFVKLLRAGDSYQVPKQDGLIMDVGNAGGLQVVVDGTAIKPLGPVDMPVFNVSLDPDALLKHRD